MATPDFILELRRHIGHAPLWLSGVTAVVMDPQRTSVLLVRRADTGAWTPVTGIIDPGEEPAAAGGREVEEEAGVLARPVRLVDVRTLPLITYENGDQAQYLDLCFLFEHVSGDPHPADGENTHARWFDLEELPELSPRFQEQIACARAGGPAAEFRV
ncbi:NUDIX domain-containing protein [Brachybacterium sp. JHP9]|uniref:NUDIX domain-containing protein n=1 Tax=Brachybacterium equifaecis TaxID=2910770 RepID=A0ABT0R0D2_9MICO|nr:NUDIX domain-containing protein [Brachybacterium equifaecis]